MNRYKEDRSGDDAMLETIKIVPHPDYDRTTMDDSEYLHDQLPAVEEYRTAQQAQNYRDYRDSPGHNRVIAWANRQHAREEELARKYKDRYPVSPIKLDLESKLSREEEDNNNIKRSIDIVEEDEDTKYYQDSAGGVTSVRSQLEEILEFARHCKLFHDDEDEEDSVESDESARASAVRNRLRQLESNFGGQTRQAYSPTGGETTNLTNEAQAMKKKRRRKGFALFGSRKNQKYVVAAFFLIMVASFVVTLAILKKQYNAHLQNLNKSVAAAAIQEQEGSPAAPPSETYSALVKMLVPYFSNNYASAYWDGSNPIATPLTAAQVKSKAMHWLATQDETSIDVADNFDSYSEDQKRMVLERYVLAVLYYSTNGPNWQYQHGFLNASAPVSEWRNTTATSCNSVSSSEEHEWFCKPITSLNQQITEIDIGENFLNGVIPSELSRLSNLAALAIYNNAGLRGSIPSELGTLSKLGFVGMAYNHIVGTLPTEVTSLPSLEYLLVTGNKNLNGTIPSELLGGSSILKAVSLSGNSFSGTLPTQGLLSMTSTSLFHFDISYNPDITGQLPSELSKLVNLTFLQIQDTSVTGSLNDLCASANLLVATADIGCDSVPEVDCSCCTCDGGS